MALMRLDRMLANSGIGTRSQVKKLLRSGKVRVNGKEQAGGEVKIDPQRDSVVVDGREICFQEHVYIMLNKPAGVLSASRDSRQKTVVDLIPDTMRRPGLFPAGRLDKDTEGMLILTDDGAFSHEILSPSKHVPKTYLAKLDKPVVSEDRQAFRDGIILEDGTGCLPAKLETVDEQGFVARIVINQGKYHQIKRMFAARGKEVLYLKRIAMGNLALDESLAPGQARGMSRIEMENIKSTQ